MAKTFDLGHLLLHVINIQPMTPPVHLAPTYEIEPPYRKSHSLVIRLSWGKALVLGWWRHTGATDEEALYEALSGRGIDLYDDDVDLNDPEVRHQIREAVAQSGVELDDEWQIIGMLGVDE